VSGWWGDRTVNAATLDYKSLALAGLVQCAELVRSTATGLHVDEAARTAVIQAITTHDARDLAEVFPDPALLRPGVAAAIATLSGENDRVDILRYTLQLVDLAGRLKRSPVVTQRLAGGLDRLGSQPQDVALAGLYQETISTLGKRIQVTGNPAVLQQAADAVRALLLAGVRFAWLWNQLGGSRWQLIIKRKAVLADLQALLATL